jgi:hypothetical protein
MQWAIAASPVQARQTRERFVPCQKTNYLMSYVRRYKSYRRYIPACWLVALGFISIANNRLGAF